MADSTAFRMTAFDRALGVFAPQWALARLRARAAAITLTRHYEAASSGRRTQNWGRRTADANVAAGDGALSTLRALSRDMVRNDVWAKSGIRVITRNVVGWGITPKPKGAAASGAFREAWEDWSGSTDCDASGRLTFSGLQKLVMRGVCEAGEMLVRRRWRRPQDGLALPMQLQVLEPDFLDTNKTGITGIEGGPITYGIEHDAIGRRVAYWLFDQHPGSALTTNSISRRVPASEVIHVYDVERAGQERGIPWLAAAIVKLKEFGEFEDAQLMRQKIAACFAAFVSDVDGDPSAALVGAASTTEANVETIEPGMVQRLPAGKQITTANPPLTTDDGFSVRTLRGIAAGLGITYEDLTGDYSQVNFSSARMSRLAHWGNVYDWQWNMLIPQFCDPAWRWALDAAGVAGTIAVGETQRAAWTPMPMPLTDPDKEARANVTRIRSGQATLSEVIREMGRDPGEHLAEYAADMKTLDRLGIWLDSDVRRVSQAGLTQGRAGIGGGAGGEAEKPAKPAEDDAEPAAEE